MGKIKQLYKCLLFYCYCLDWLFLIYLFPTNKLSVCILFRLLMVIVTLYSGIKYFYSCREFIKDLKMILEKINGTYAISNSCYKSNDLFDDNETVISELVLKTASLNEEIININVLMLTIKS